MKHLLHKIVFGLILLPMVSLSQTILSLQPNAANGKDALLANCVPCGYINNNYGNDDDVAAIAWTNGGNISYCRGLVEFDLTSIPANAIILSAQLSLYHNYSSNNLGHSTLSGGNDFIVQRVTQAWTESTVTWSNQPTATLVNQVMIPASTATNQNYPNINVTAIVQDMITSGQNYGFMIRQQTETHYRSMLFASSDHADEKIHPKLVVTYTEPPNSVSEEKGTEDNWVIFPNPNKGIFTIKSENLLEQIEIFNVNGSLVYSERLSNTTSKEINISSLSAGIYFVKIASGEQSYIKKIVKE
ncbi:MAG: hypothetical protein K0S32_3488 [Bacteroidetes bacterium]|jgi:hypothetical protein|nr:hypothetical protein [Bacteroidota bacterium]